MVDIGVRRTDLQPDQLAAIRRMLHSQPARRFVNGRKLAESLETLR
jgi:hypothetical protein